MPVNLDALLEAAVAGVGGTERPGQVEMAHAVADAVETGAAFWHMVDLVWILMFPIVYLVR